MATVISDRVYTPDDLLRLPDGKFYELVDGQLVGTEMGAIECRVAMILGAALTQFVEARKLGSLFSELQYRCFDFEPGLIRRPDISFIRSARLSTDVLAAGMVRIPPDMAIEIVSPHDAYHEVDEKVDEYLRAGVRLVWIINPRQMSVLVHRQDGSTVRIVGDGELDGEDVIPGLSLRLASMLAAPPAG